MYQTTPIVPMAATGMVVSYFSGWNILFGICAVFAILGALLAVKRFLPVPKFVKNFRARKQARLLTNLPNK